MKRIALFAALALIASFAHSPAQTETLPLGQPTYGAITETTTNVLSAQGAATINSADQVAYGRGAYCTFNQSAHTGTPSTTFSIMAKDTASNSYRALLTSAAITADATPTTLLVYPGVQTTSLPSNMTAISLPLTAKFRVQIVVGGTTPQVTGTVGCSIIP